jgi:hypothetical protein
MEHESQEEHVLVYLIKITFKVLKNVVVYFEINILTSIVLKPIHYTN